jgi:hypothetical protein
MRAVPAVLHDFVYQMTLLLRESRGVRAPLYVFGPIRFDNPQFESASGGRDRFASQVASGALKPPEHCCLSKRLLVIGPAGHPGFRF